MPHNNVKELLIELLGNPDYAKHMREFVINAFQEIGYDPEEIYEMATAMGMIPADRAQHIQVQVTLQEPEAEPTGWENFCKFLAGLFA